MGVGHTVSSVKELRAERSGTARLKGLSCACFWLCRPSSNYRNPMDWPDQTANVVMASPWSRGKMASRSAGTCLLFAPWLTRTSMLSTKWRNILLWRGFTSSSLLLLNLWLQWTLRIFVLADLGRKISDVSGYCDESWYMFQFQQIFVVKQGPHSRNFLGKS